MIRIKIILLMIVNKIIYCVLFIPLLFACEKKQVCQTVGKQEYVFIIFNYNKDNTTVTQEEINGKQIIEILRVHTIEPDLRINISQVLESNELKISRSELEKCNILFDKNMDYQIWFELDYEHYFLISESDFNQTDNEELSAMEVLLNVSGLE